MMPTRATTESSGKQPPPAGTHAEQRAGIDARLDAEAVFDEPPAVVWPRQPAPAEDGLLGDRSSRAAGNGQAEINDSSDSREAAAREAVR